MMKLLVLTMPWILMRIISVKSSVPPSGEWRSKFPINELYNDTAVQYQHYRNWLCDGTYRYNRIMFEVQPCCDCDDNCWRYKTCCIDKSWNEYTPVNLDTYMNKFKTILKLYKPTSCLTILPLTNHSTNHEIETVYMVSSCLPSSEKELINLCQNTSKTKMARDLLPVLGNDTYLYKNRYCAKCNDIFNFEYQTLEIKCVGAKNVTAMSVYFLYQQKDCIVKLKKTENTRSYIRGCQKQELLDVSQSYCSVREYELCQLHIGRISNGYNNFFCWKCSPHFNRSDSYRHMMCDKKCGRQKKCHLPEDRDLSKYTFQFDLALNNKTEEFKVLNLQRKFPIWEFLGVPSDSFLAPLEGFEQYLCGGHRMRCCNCRDNCFRKNDCCVDFLWNEASPVELKTYENKLADNLKYHVCRPVYLPANNSKYNVIYRLMIKSCRPDAISVDRSNCLVPDHSVQSPQIIVPVLGSDGEIYANSFCAKCNFINQYTYFNLSLNCEGVNFQDNDFAANTTVNLEITQKIRRCNLDIAYLTSEMSNATICSKSHASDRVNPCSYNDSRYHLCKIYQLPIDGYYNYHCRSCAVEKKGIERSMIKYCDITEGCLYGNCMDPSTTPKPIVIPSFRWSLILAFTDHEANLKYSDHRGTLQSNCKSGQYFEISLAKCVEVFCPKGFTVKGLECVEQSNIVPIGRSMKESNITSSTAISYYVYFTVRTQGHLAIPAPRNLTYEAISSTDDIKIFRSTEPTNPTNLDNLHYPVFLAEKFDSGLITEEYGLSFSRIFNDKLCAILKGTTREHELPQQLSVSPKSVTHWISFETGKAKFHSSECYVFHLTKPCLRKFIPRNQTTKDRNMSITVTDLNEKQQIYHAEEYFPSINGYQVCLNKNIFLYQNVDANDDFQLIYQVEYFITIFGTSTSVVCYLCIILTFASFKDLRNISGLNNCFMCISLLFADLLTLSSLGFYSDTTSCFILAILMHWILLAVYSWTLVSAYDLVHCFGSLRVNNSRCTGKKFSRRALPAFLIPAFVVAIGVGLDKTGAYNFGYGDFTVCWRINNPEARIIFYIIPTGLAILITLTSLCYTIRRIAAVKKNVNRYTDSQGNSKINLIKLAIKLSVILGITEIIGYIQIPAPGNKFNVYLGFIYAVSRSFRGAMLWFVYVHGSAISNRYKLILSTILSRRKRNSQQVTVSSQNLPRSNDKAEI